MHKAPSVKLNFVMNFILTISSFIFPLTTFPYVSRVLGVQGVGLVQFATANVAYFVMVAMLGIPTYGIRACAKVRDDRKRLSQTVQELLWINLMMSIIASLALVLAVYLIPAFQSEKQLYYVLSTNIAFNLIGVEWLYKATEQYTYMTLRSIAAKLLGLILMFVWVKGPDDYVIYGAITVISALGLNFLNFLNLRRIIDVKPIIWSQLDFAQHLKPILNFFLLTVSTIIYLNLDTSLLGFIKGHEFVGYYSAAVKVKLILVSVVTSLGAVLLPRLSFYYEQGRFEQFQALTQKALNFVWVLALPLVVYFMLFAKESIYFLSGLAYQPAILPMQLIMPAVLFIGLSNLTGIQILVPTNREHLVVFSTIVGAGVDLLLNSFSIPFWGASGAALAGSVAELAVLLVQLYYLADFILPMLKQVQYIKLIVGLLVGAGMALVSHPLSLTLINQIAWKGARAYFVSLAITGASFFISYGLTLLALKEPFCQQFFLSIKGKLPHH